MKITLKNAKTIQTAIVLEKNKEVEVVQASVGNNLPMMEDGLTYKLQGCGAAFVAKGKMTEKQKAEFAKLEAAIVAIVDAEENK